jgi:monoamine oxidase
MHKFENGMEELPKAFINQGGLKNNILYRTKVQKVDYSKNSVIVTASTLTGERQFHADYVIITAPLNIISNMSFNPSLPAKKQDALTKVNYVPSTKVTILWRKKFWLDQYNLRGGFSKSTTLLGQFHYETAKNTDWEERGVTICYTWNHEALVWQSMSNDEAVALVAGEIARIHATKIGTNIVDEGKRKEILSYLESGKVQAWYADPNTQGAFVLYNDYSSSYLCDLAEPVGHCDHCRNVFFAGEGISFTHGWIQGALESGIAASYFLAQNRNHFGL